MIHYRIAHGEKYLGCPGSPQGENDTEGVASGFSYIEDADGNQLMFDLRKVSDKWFPQNYEEELNPHGDGEILNSYSNGNRTHKYITKVTTLKPGQVLQRKNPQQLDCVNIYFNDNGKYGTNHRLDFYCQDGSRFTIRKNREVGKDGSETTFIYFIAPDLGNDCYISFDSSDEAYYKYDRSRNIGITLCPYYVHGSNNSITPYIYIKVLVPLTIDGWKTFHLYTTSNYIDRNYYRNDGLVRASKSRFFDLEELAYQITTYSSMIIEEIIHEIEE